VADRVLGDLGQDGVAAGQRGLDAASLAAEPGRVPVDLAGVDHRVTTLADVDERRLHRRQHVLHPTQEDTADHRVGTGLGHEVLDQDSVLEQRDLGKPAALADGHHPLDGLPARQELRFGEDLRTPTGGITGVPTALPLGLQPGGSTHSLDLVGHRTGGRRGGLRQPRFPDVHDGVVRVVLAGRLVAGGTPATTATTAVAAADPTDLGARFGVGVVTFVRVAVGFGVVLGRGEQCDGGIDGGVARLVGGRLAANLVQCVLIRRALFRRDLFRRSLIGAVLAVRHPAPATPAPPPAAAPGTGVVLGVGEVAVRLGAVGVVRLGVLGGGLGNLGLFGAGHGLTRGCLDVRGRGVRGRDVRGRGVHCVAGGLGIGPVDGRCLPALAR
jgi:hypothetical protein